MLWEEDRNAGTLNDRDLEFGKTGAHEEIDEEGEGNRSSLRKPVEPAAARKDGDLELNPLKYGNDYMAVPKEGHDQWSYLADQALKKPKKTEPETNIYTTIIEKQAAPAQVTEPIIVEKPIEPKKKELTEAQRIQLVTKNRSGAIWNLISN